MYVGDIIKFKERYSGEIKLAQITSEVPVEQMSLYYYYAKPFDSDESFGLAGHEVIEVYGAYTVEEFKEKFPEKLI